MSLFSATVCGSGKNNAMSMMQSVLRVTDRFYGIGDTEAIERTGRLQNCILLVLIFHLTMVIAFIRLEQFEKAHPRMIRDVDINFAFTPPPPEPPPKEGELRSPLALTAGANPGSMDAASPVSSANAPSLKAPATNATPTPIPARPRPSHRTTMAAPVALTPVNVIKAPVLAPKEAPTTTAIPLVAGANSQQPLSGSKTAGGAPGAGEVSIGAGGNGAGGGGTGQGNFGTGTGFGPPGAIATRLPTGATRAMGNIAPYRKDLLMRLAQSWHPKKPTDVIVLLQLDKAGKLLSAAIFQSSGSKKIDKQALKALQATDYAPLPDWYKGEHLTFKIELSKVEALQQ